MAFYKKSKLHTGTALICSLAIVFSALPVYATDTIDNLQNQTSALENELKGINQDILTLSEKISDTEMQVELLNSDIDKTQDDLEKAQKNEDQQYEDMKSRIKYMYEHGSATMLEMLFSAENMSDFLNKADFIENLSNYDRKALNNLKDVHQQIADQKADLEAQQASMKDLQNQLQTQQTQLQAKAAATSTNLNEVNAKLQKAKEEEAARQAEEARKQAEAAAKAEAAASANKQNSSSSSSNSSSNSSSGSSSSSSGSSSSGGSNSSGGSTVASDDVTLLAAILQCEARYDYDSMLAVATVIMNRVNSGRFPNSISGVVYASGQFAPVWTGSLDRVLKAGPRSLSIQVAQDAINGARHSSVSDCYYFLYAASTNRTGVVIGGNVFFTSW
jgi:peptidoglycan hydrolase CwlO-like protein